MSDLFLFEWRQELVLALSDLCRGPADKKLRWAFHIYDHDGDGVISRNELEDVALSINELTGDNAASGGDPLVANATARIWVDRIFQVDDGLRPHFLLYQHCSNLSFNHARLRCPL